MAYPRNHSVENSFPLSEATHDHRYWQAHGGVTQRSMAYTQSSPYEVTYNDFIDPLFHLRGPVMATGQRSLPVPAAHTFPYPVSVRGNALSVDNGHSMLSSAFLGPSESSAYEAQQASLDNACVVCSQSVHADQRDKTRSIFSSMTVSVPTSGRAVPASLHPQHVVSWHLTCQDAVILNGPRTFVPQTIYQPHSEGDKERYISLAKLQPPIVFLTPDSPEWGIPISQLLSRQLTHLVGEKEPAFASCGPSIGIRVNWPGYRPFHKQVQTRDYTPERRMINKAKLAKMVAKSVKQFVDTMAKQAMQAESDQQWKVGSSGILAEDIILVSLHHVSQGSWQPQLRLRRVVGTEVIVGAQQGHRGI